MAAQADVKAAASHDGQGVRAGGWPVRGGVKAVETDHLTPKCLAIHAHVVSEGMAAECDSRTKGERDEIDGHALAAI